MLSIDPWNILWTLINLLVLYFIFKKFLFKPVMDVINARQKMIDDQFESAQKDRQDARNLKDKYQEKLESAKSEADSIILEARQRAQKEHDIAVEATKAETQNMLEKAKADIANEQEKATVEAKDKIARLALMAAKKIVETGDTYDTGSNK